MRRLLRFHFTGSAGLLAVLLVASPGPALSQLTGFVAMPPGDQLLMSRMSAGSDLNRYLEQLRNDFYQIDADGDGKLTERDVAVHGVMETVQLRMASLTRVMRYDLDGDGAVTEDEVRRSAKYDLRSQLALAAANPASGPGLEEQIQRLVAAIMVLDADKDGKVTVAEAFKFGQVEMQRMFAQTGQSARTRQALTVTSSGEVALVDYEAAGEALFRKIDSDNDGRVSQQELTDYRSKPEPPDAKLRSEAAEAAQKRVREKEEVARKKREAVEAERTACDMPAASDGAKLVLLSAYESEALSSVTIGSQDSEVRAGRVVVEPGSERLYVVITSHRPTIWQFSGATDRIERLVMTSAITGPDGGDARKSPLVGATGIPRDRITFFARSNCLNYFTEAPSSGSLQTSSAVRKATGKPVEVMAAKYAVGSFSIPSGKIDSVREGEQPLIKGRSTFNIIGTFSNIMLQMGQGRARDEMDRFFPGGVIEIDPNAVVASAPVAVYEVLPSQAGLVQLMAKGKLTQNRSGEFIVRDKIRFPPGLHGAHSVTFLVMKGAPYPDGDPGHSCVIVEETGESKGAVCRSR